MEVACNGDEDEESGSLCVTLYKHRSRKKWRVYNHSHPGRGLEADITRLLRMEAPIELCC